MQTRTASKRAGGTGDATTHRVAPQINDVSGVTAEENGWTNDELERIDQAEELELASRRPDGALGPFATIWVVRINDAVYVRSAFGYDNEWFQQALKAGAGRIRAGGVVRDVDIDVPGAEEVGSVSGAYHEKYDRFGPRMVGTVVSPEAERSTLRLLPSLPTRSASRP